MTQPAPSAPTVVNSLPEPAEPLFTEAATELLGWLVRVHGPALEALLQARTLPPVLSAPADPEGIRDAAWRVAAPPADLAVRTVEITGPAQTAMLTKALACGANVVMADIEDALSPTAANISGAYDTLRAASAGRLSEGVERPATLTIRPRGLHLPEPRVTVDGRIAPACLVDVALLGVHCAPASTARGSGLYLYLPKLQSHHEAQWWDAVLADVERRVGLAPNSIRVTVLIEHVLAALAMEDILYALRERMTGLNAGRWDYLFSAAKVMPDHVLPDRSAVTMRVPFMAAYAERLVAICRRRGAQPIGGMSAFIPRKNDVAANERAFAAVKADKEREAGLGYVGTWVAHPGLVEVAAEAFAADWSPAPVEGTLAALLDVSMPGVAPTLAGVTANVSVSLRYLAAWLGGLGAVALDDLMEDAATAEIARCQLWQWVHAGTTLDDGTVVTPDLVRDLIATAVAGDEGLARAAGVISSAVFAEELPEFLTLLALPLLD